MNTVFMYRLSAPAHLPEALKVKLNNELFLSTGNTFNSYGEVLLKANKRRKASPCIKIRLSWILKMPDLPIQL